MAVGQVFYTPWCDEAGKVIDDGTVHRLADDRFRWTAADPQLRWLRQNAAGLDVTIEETTERTAAVALQGPLSRQVLEAATGESFADLRYFRRRGATIAGVAGRREPDRLHGRPRLRAVGRHGARRRAVGRADGRAGETHGIRPAGMLALDVVRLEAGSSCSRSTTRAPATR